MPRISDKEKLNDPFLDRRTKMLPCQKERCFRLWGFGVSITMLSKIFNVNKRTIQFLLFPERHEKNKADRDARGGSTAYYHNNKEAFNKSFKDHRKYKNATLKETIKQTRENPEPGKKKQQVAEILERLFGNGWVCSARSLTVNYGATAANGWHKWDGYMVSPAGHKYWVYSRNTMTEIIKNGATIVNKKDKAKGTEITALKK